MKKRILVPLAAIALMLSSATGEEAAQENYLAEGYNPSYRFNSDNYTEPNDFDHTWRFFTYTNSDGTGGHLTLVDVLNTYTYPISIRSSANNEYSLTVNTSGDVGLAGYSVFIDRSEQNVGIGTVSPTTKLHVNDVISSSEQVVTELLALSFENTDASGFSDTGFKLENVKEGVQWTFRTLESDTLVPGITNSFAISKKASGGKEMIITGVDSEGGNQLILANGAKCVNGVWTNKSSRASKENIKELSSQDAMAAFHKLQPMTYNYKSDKKESYVGFIAEDVPELVAVNSRDGLSAMDMVAVLTKVVQEQERVMAETRAELKDAQEKIAKVELLLTNIALDTSSSQSEKVSLNLK